MKGGFHHRRIQKRKLGGGKYSGGLGAEPQWGPGAKPLVGGQGASPPEADDILLLTDLILMLKCRPTQKKRRNI
jgi:hypothetical protein